MKLKCILDSMNILTAFGLLFLGFFILIVGGEFLIRSAISIAARFKVNPTLIGLTVIAAGTSAPEMMTSIMAAMNGSPDIAVGNVVGSNIFNILAIIGISCLIMPNKIDRSMARFEIPALILFNVLFFLFALNLYISRIEGAVLVAGLAVFLFFSIRRSKLYPQQARDEDEEINILKHRYLDVLYLIFGFLGLTFGAHYALQGGVQLGQIAGLSERIIGLTIISVGTGLPELATSAVAAYRGRDDIAISNVIGSNIMNILLALGVAASIQPLSVKAKILNFDMIWMLAATVAIAPIIYFSKSTIGRKTGLILISVYIAYVAILIGLR